MDLNRKLELLTASVRSISQHDDLDAAVRHAAMDRVEAIVASERLGIDARVKAAILSNLSPAGQDSAG